MGKTVPVLLTAKPELKPVVANFLRTEPSGARTVVRSEPEIQRFCAASKAGKKQAVAQGNAELGRGAPVVENLETVAALTGPKLMTHGLSWASMAMEYGRLSPPPLKPFVPE